MTSGWALIYLRLEALYGAVYTKTYVEDDNVRIFFFFKAIDQSVREA